MALPDFILNNFRWKVGALTLAVFVWFLIQFAISKGYRPSEHPLTAPREHTFTDLPVLVLTPPDDTQLFKITPAKVDVTIHATAIALNRLIKADIKAFVDLADVTNAIGEIKEVLVQTPEGVEISNLKAKPPHVKVERGVVP